MLQSRISRMSSVRGCRGFNFTEPRMPPQNPLHAATKFRWSRPVSLSGQRFTHLRLKKKNPLQTFPPLKLPAFRTEDLTPSTSNPKDVQMRGSDFRWSQNCFCNFSLFSSARFRRCSSDSSRLDWKKFWRLFWWERSQAWQNYMLVFKVNEKDSFNIYICIPSRKY